MKEITLVITQKVIYEAVAKRDSGDYNCLKDCLIATALKRRGIPFISVGCIGIYYDDDNEFILNEGVEDNIYAFITRKIVKPFRTKIKVPEVV